MPGHFKWSKVESVDYLVNTYFESITEWLLKALGLYRIIFDVVYGSWILSLLLFTLGIGDNPTSSFTSFSGISIGIGLIGVISGKASSSDPLS